MRGRLRCTPLSLFAALVVGCGADDADIGYSRAELGEGITFAVDDDAGAIASATVFLPDELPSYVALRPRFERERVVVLQPGGGGYDAVVVHLTGPFCGAPPAVSVDGDQDRLMVEIATVTEGVGESECAAMEYDEAIGFDLVSEFEDAQLAVTQVD